MNIRTRSRLTNHMRMARATERFCDTSGLFHQRSDLTNSFARSLDHQLESRMREIRLSGSEGGGGSKASPYPYLRSPQRELWDLSRSIIKPRSGDISNRAIGGLGGETRNVAAPRLNSG